MKYINLFKNHSSYESEVNGGGGVDFKIPNVSYCEDVKDVHYNPYNTVEFYVGEITGTTPETVKIYTDETNHVDITVGQGNKWYTYVLPKSKGLFRIKRDSVKKVIVKADINTNNESIIPYSTVEASFKGSNTSNVTNMGQMFYGRSSLTSLDVSSFDTSNVTWMGNMFYDCGGLTFLDVSNFNTSNVTNMYQMFANCRSLTSLDLSKWDTSKVTDMSYMFDNCYGGLTSLDVSSFDTSNVTNTECMFRGCISLVSLDLSKWDTSKVTNVGNMFTGCAKLKTIKMVGCSEDTIDKIKAQLTTDGIINNVTIVTE